MDHTADEGTTSRFSPRVALRGMIAFTFLSALTLNTLAGGAAAQEPRKAGKEGRILVTLDWGEVPLRERLTEFGKKYSVSVFLDRRVDPDQKIELSARDLPVEGVLAQVAENLKLGICTVGKVHYIGPRSITSRLPAVVAQRKSELAKSPVRAIWTKPKELKWTEASSPRDLALALVQEAGLTLENAEKIPHDVWPAYNLPAMTLTERLTMVLAGFDLTFQVIADGQVRVTSIPEGITTVPDGTTDDPQTAGTKKTVTKGPVKKIFSLTVQKQAAGSVVSTVAKQLGKEFKYDPSIRDKLKENVSFAVKDVSLEELLTKTLKPLGLSFKITETTIEIIPLP
ncbi:MAG: hypothetical protein K8R36_02235 [Planctomycetales bacterium]|nr:hypothetical protein [Planctomycetales bacterium]